MPKTKKKTNRKPTPQQLRFKAAVKACRVPHVKFRECMSEQLRKH